MSSSLRSLILASADRLLARRGYRHMTIEDLATEAGIGKGTVYLHFGSKEDIALAAIQGHIDAAFAVIAALAQSDAPVAIRLNAMLVARVMERADRFRHYSDSLHDLLAAIRPRLLAQREQQLEQESALFVRVLTEAAPDASLTTLRPLARALLTGTNALLPYYLTPEQLGRRATLLRQTRAVATLLVHGALDELRHSDQASSSDTHRVARGEMGAPRRERTRRGRAAGRGVARLLFCMGALGSATACASSPGRDGVAGVQGAALAADAVAGQRLTDWMRAYNTGDSAAMAQALGRLYSPAALARRSAEARVGSPRLWWADYGPLEIVRADSVSTSAAVVTVRAGRTRGWGRLYVDVDSTVPHYLTGIALDPFVEPTDWRMVEHVRTDALLAARVRDLANDLHAGGVFEGVVLITRGGDTLLSHAVGTADRDARVPNGISTAFELASVSKMFTAAAVARLIEDGRLRPEATVAELLPEFPRGPVGRVTVQQLLTMSSGIPDVFRSPRFWRERASLSSLRDYWRFVAVDSLEFAPGTAWSYSNSNFFLLGSIIEQVSGTPFARFVEEQVFRRAGMTRTAYRSKSLPRLAVGYARTPTGSGPGASPVIGGRFRTGGTPTDTAPGGPAGGGASTAGDLAAFGHAVMRHRLLRPETVERLFTPYVRSEYGGADGWGFETRTWNGVAIVGHGGTFSGVSNQVDYYPRLDIAVVVLSNVDGSGAQALANYARALLARRYGADGSAR